MCVCIVCTFNTFYCVQTPNCVTAPLIHKHAFVWLTNDREALGLRILGSSGIGPVSTHTICLHQACLVYILKNYARIYSLKLTVDINLKNSWEDVNTVLLFWNHFEKCTQLEFARFMDLFLVGLSCCIVWLHLTYKLKLCTLTLPSQTHIWDCIQVYAYNTMVA